MLKRLTLASALLVALNGLAQASFVQSPILPLGPYSPPRPDASTNTQVNLLQSNGLEYRSPFESTVQYGRAPFTAVQANGSALFNVRGTRLSLVWGSPDPYNVLSLYSGPNGTGELVESIDGSQINAGSREGFSYVSITAAAPFQSIVLTNPGFVNGFEFADLTASGGPSTIVGVRKHHRRHRAHGYGHKHHR